MTTTTKPSKFFAKHKAAIESGVYGKGMIAGLRKALHSDDRRSQGYSTSATAANVSSEELTALLDLVAEKKPGVDTTEQGLAFLHKYAKKALGHREREILDAFDRFAFVGVRDIGNRMSFFVPEFEVIAKDGSSFCCTVASWQSGGKGPEVTG